MPEPTYHPLEVPSVITVFGGYNPRVNRILGPGEDYYLRVGFNYPYDPTSAVKAWSDTAATQGLLNPGGTNYHPVYFDGMVGGDQLGNQPGYLVLAVDDMGNWLKAPWETLGNGDRLPFVDARRWLKNMTQSTIYSKYAALWPAGVPYLEPLHVQIARHGRLVSVAAKLPNAPYNANFSSSMNLIPGIPPSGLYQVSVPVFQRDGWVLVPDKMGKPAFVDAFEFSSLTPAPSAPPVGSGGAARLLAMSDLDLVQAFGNIIQNFSSTLADKAVAIRTLLSR